MLWEIQVKEMKLQVGNKAEDYQVLDDVLHSRIKGAKWKKNTKEVVNDIFCLFYMMFLPEVARKRKMLKNFCSFLMHIFENQSRKCASRLVAFNHSDFGAETVLRDTTHQTKPEWILTALVLWENECWSKYETTIRNIWWGVKHLFLAYMALLFVQETLRLPRLPRTVISYSDKGFISNYWKELFRLAGTYLRFSTKFWYNTSLLSAIKKT